MELEDLAAGGGVAAGDGNDPLAQQTGNVPIPGSRRQKVAARLREADAARARQRALGPPDAEALHAELVHHLTHQLDGTVRPVPTDYCTGTSKRIGSSAWACRSHSTSREQAKRLER